MVELNLSDDRVRLAVLVVVLLLAAIVAAVNLWEGGGISGTASRRGGLAYESRDVPPLLIDGIGSDREVSAASSGNPFAYRPPPTPTPNLTPPPTPTPTGPRIVRPTPTPRVVIGLDGQRLPPPPPFDRDFIGSLGPRSLPVAAFRKPGRDTSEVEVAWEGEVIDEVFIVREIGHESVTIGFVGYPPSEDQRVPLSEK